MAFKQNLPAVAILGSAAAIVGLIVLLQPPDEDQLRQAAAAHLKGKPEVRDYRVVGEVVDVQRADQSVQHLAFSKASGSWAFDRDLNSDFAARMQDPAVGAEILTRLGTRIGQRYNTGVKLPPGMRYAYRLFRDEKGVVGEVTTFFDYPKIGDKNPQGRYVEQFRWSGGQWVSQGTGALYDMAPR